MTFQLKHPLIIVSTPDQTPETRWSGRKTAAFVVGTCSVFWGLVAVVLAVLK